MSRHFCRVTVPAKASSASSLCSVACSSRQPCSLPLAWLRSSAVPRSAPPSGCRLGRADRVHRSLARLASSTLAALRCPLPLALLKLLRTPLPQVGRGAHLPRPPPGCLFASNVALSWRPGRLRIVSHLGGHFRSDCLSLARSHPGSGSFTLVPPLLVGPPNTCDKLRRARPSRMAFDDSTNAERAVLHFAPHL